MYLREMSFDDSLNCIELLQDTVQWQATVLATLKFFGCNARLIQLAS
jgi:hypothetical protein